MEHFQKQPSGLGTDGECGRSRSACTHPHRSARWQWSADILIASEMVVG